MARFKHLVLVCTNERDASDAKRDCKARGGQQLLDALKEQVQKNGLKGKVRVVRSGCLDFCAKGCAAVVFSEGGQERETWYTGLTPEDAETLCQSHLVEGKVLLDKVSFRS
jgi:(2Fe-2S) ferredoxin